MAAGRAYWDNDLTKIFLDLCITEKEKMNFNLKKGLTKAGWNNLYHNFRQQTGRAYGNKQLQNKFNSLKRLFKVWRKLKNTSGARWDNTTGTIRGDEAWWQARILDDPEAEQLRNRPLAYKHELTFLFGSMDTEEGDMLCAGGTADTTPSGGSGGNRAPVSDDDVSRSSVGRIAQRPGKEQVVDSRPPKRTKSIEYHLETNRNQTSAIRQEQDEVIKLLQVVEKDGVDQRSELYFIATELFMSAARRAAFMSIRAPDRRIAWLRWTWDNARKN
ncbi:hypothetical protein ACP4OV_031005 [Aristida adscensionis]